MNVRNASEYEFLSNVCCNFVAFQKISYFTRVYVREPHKGWYLRILATSILCARARVYIDLLYLARSPIIPCQRFQLLERRDAH